MDLAVIRNNTQRDRLIEMIKERRIPFKCAIQDIYPKRSVDWNAYLWGVLYYEISVYTGHTPEEVHAAYKRKFNFRHDFKFNKRTGKWTFVSKVDSTTAMNTVESMEYALKIRADAQLELMLTLPLPNEELVKELIFEMEMK